MDLAKQGKLRNIFMLEDQSFNFHEISARGPGGKILPAPSVCCIALILVIGDKFYVLLCNAASC